MLGTVGYNVKDDFIEPLSILIFQKSLMTSPDDKGYLAISFTLRQSNETVRATTLFPIGRSPVFDL